MGQLRRRPLVCVSGSLLPVTDAGYMVHGAGERNIDSLERFSDCLPLVLPSLGSRLEIRDLLKRMDGVLLTGARANVEPHHYGGQPFPKDEPIDPERDETILAVVSEAVTMGLPVFGICRGIQEMNVALGGSLYYRVHLEPGLNDHRMPQHDNVTEEEIFELKHSIEILPGGVLDTLSEEKRVMVNSLHGQGIDEVGPGLKVEAVAPDGVIEAISLLGAKTFTVGVQWHAEWKPEEHPLSRRLFETFGEAARVRASETKVNAV